MVSPLLRMVTGHVYIVAQTVCTVWLTVYIVWQTVCNSALTVYTVSPGVCTV